MADNHYQPKLHKKRVLTHADCTVYSVSWDASGNVNSITLRNPWGIDTDSASGPLDGSNDGFVTVTPAQLYALQGRVDYGRV